LVGSQALESELRRGAEHFQGGFEMGWWVEQQRKAFEGKNHCVPGSEEVANWTTEEGRINILRVGAILCWIGALDMAWWATFGGKTFLYLVPGTIFLFVGRYVWKTPKKWREQ
jgi:hypothetical protein